MSGYRTQGWQRHFYEGETSYHAVDVTAAGSAFKQFKQFKQSLDTANEASRNLCMAMCGQPTCPGRCGSDHVHYAQSLPCPTETIYLETECGWIIEIEE